MVFTHIYKTGQGHGMAVWPAVLLAGLSSVSSILQRRKHNLPEFHGAQPHRTSLHPLAAGYPSSHSAAFTACKQTRLASSAHLFHTMLQRLALAMRPGWSGKGC